MSRSLPLRTLECDNMSAIILVTPSLHITYFPYNKRYVNMIFIVKKNNQILTFKTGNVIKP